MNDNTFFENSISKTANRGAVVLRFTKVHDTNEIAKYDKTLDTLCFEKSLALEIEIEMFSCCHIYLFSNTTTTHFLLIKTRLAYLENDNLLVSYESNPMY